MFVIILLAESQELNPVGKLLIQILFVAFLVGCAVYGIIKGIENAKKRQAMLDAMTPAEREEFLRKEAEAKEEAKLAKQWGPINPPVICQQCQRKGTVRTKQVDRDKGISGGKAAAATLTGGWSILVTGLANKEKAVQVHCMNCNCTWYL